MPERAERTQKSLSGENPEDKVNLRTPGEIESFRERCFNHMQAVEDKTRKSTTEALTSSLENSQHDPELNLTTAVNSSKSQTLLNLSAKVDSVETSAPTEKEKKLERLKRIGAWQIPGFPNMVQLTNNGKKIDGTSDEGRPSELAHQEYVPELMPDPTSMPPAPAHRACWTVPKNPVSNRKCPAPIIKIDEQGTSGSSQLVRGESVKFIMSKRAERMQKSQSVCENRNEAALQTPEESFRGRYLNHLQAVEENKRKSTTEASTASLESSRSALNLSTDMEQSAVTTLADFTEPIPDEVSPVEINAPTEKEKKIEQLMRMGAVQIPGFSYIVQLRNNGNKVDATNDEGGPSELAHQEHVPELMPDPTSEPSAPIPRAYWTVPKDPVPNNGLQFHNSEECEELAIKSHAS